MFLCVDVLLHVRHLVKTVTDRGLRSAFIKLSLAGLCVGVTVRHGTLLMAMHAHVDECRP